MVETLVFYIEIINKSFKIRGYTFLGTELSLEEFFCLAIERESAALTPVKSKPFTMAKLIIPPTDIRGTLN